jgi:hypothetical protein
VEVAAAAPTSSLLQLTMPANRTRVVATLGTAQTLAWASSYLPAMLARPMAAGLGFHFHGLRPSPRRWWYRRSPGRMAVNALTAGAVVRC